MTHKKLTTKEHLLPFAMITALFFLWGRAHGLAEVLDKHFLDLLHITKAQLALVLMGWILDITSMSTGFLAPIPPVVFIFFNAAHGYKIRENDYGVS